MSQLTQEHLKTQFHYDPLTGALSWLVEAMRTKLHGSFANHGRVVTSA